jgi:Family of unknown function (DUF6011)
MENQNTVQNIDDDAILEEASEKYWKLVSQGVSREEAHERSQPVFASKERESAAFERMWRRSTLRHMQEKQGEWERKGLCFSWIDPEPTYCTASDWSTLLTPDVEEAFPDPKTPCIRIIRFSLLGGGQIRTIEHFIKSDIPEPGGVWCDQIDLKVTAHVGADIITVTGGEKYEGPYFEMNAQAVVLAKGREAIAERTAATFRLIDNTPENFFALMDGSTDCAICGRALQDEISKLIGVGPDCARQYWIPHNKEAAERRLALRRQLLAL